MIVLEIALALGTLGPVADAPKPLSDDCVKTAKVEHAKHKAKRKHPVRLFKTEPKPIVEPGCEEDEPKGALLTIFPAAEEPDAPFTPVPEGFFATPLPVPDVPGVETAECGCFGSSVAWFGGGGSGGYYSPFIPSGPVAAVPEPAPALLILAGLGAMAWRQGRRTV